MRTRREKLIAICRDPLDCDRVREWLAESAVVAVVADCLSLAEAVGAIQRHSPDLLLIDLRLTPPAAVRRLAYSSARSMIIFLNPSGEARHVDGLQRTATVTLADPKLFRRQIELTAELLPEARPLVSISRLLELLTNRNFRRKRQAQDCAAEELAILDPAQVTWLEGDGSQTTLHGGVTRLLRLPVTTILENFRRRGVSFAMVSDSIAINLARAQAVYVEKRGARTVILDTGVTMGIAPDRVRSIIRQLGRRQADERGRTPSALAPGAAHRTHPQRANDA